MVCPDGSIRSSIGSQMQLDEVVRSTFIQHGEFYSTLPSTNDRGIELAKSPEPIELPAVVLAVDQTMGRGRGNATWISQPGSLTFSLILDSMTFGFSVQDQPKLSLAAALAVAAAVKLHVPKAQVTCKWPNDVFLDDCKLAGILVEVPTAKRMVIGIGVNVNNVVRHVDSEFPATSLIAHRGETTDMLTLLTQILRAFETRAREMVALPDSLPKRWRPFDFLLGKSVVVHQGGNQRRGVAAGITANGHLQLDTELGRKILASGRVRTT